MAYHSEVRALIYGPPEKLDAFITAHKLIFCSDVFRIFSKYLTRYEITYTEYYPISDASSKYQTYRNTEILYHVIDFYGENWKWSEIYSDVQALMKLLKEAPEMGLKYEFIRIGENGGDIEQINSKDIDDPLLSISRPTIYDYTKRTAKPNMPISSF